MPLYHPAGLILPDENAQHMSRQDPISETERHSKQQHTEIFRLATAFRSPSEPWGADDDEVRTWCGRDAAPRAGALG